MKSLFIKKMASKALILSTVSLGIVASTLGADSTSDPNGDSTQKGSSLKKETSNIYLNPMDLTVTIDGFTNATITLMSPSHQGTLISFEKCKGSKIINLPEYPEMIFLKPN